MKAKLIFIFTTLLATLLIVDSIAQRRHPFTLRILTYNIYHGETTDGRIDMDHKD
jgi:hypothetical protein